MSETALHLASRSLFPAIASMLITHGADPFLIDGYGRRSLNWAVLYGCSDETMNQLAETRPAPSNALSQKMLKTTLMKLIRSQNETDSTWYYKLGHLLLFLNDMDAAVIAFERDLSEINDNLVQPANCDRCKLQSIKGSRYVCTSCVDTDFCEACFKDFRNEVKFKRCKNHEFLRIPREIWKDLKPDCVDENGITVEMWLINIYEKYSTE